MASCTCHVVRYCCCSATKSVHTPAFAMLDVGRALPAVRSSADGKTPGSAALQNSRCRWSYIVGGNSALAAGLVLLLLRHRGWCIRLLSPCLM